MAAEKSYDAKREAGALLDAWTNQRGPEALKIIDALASNLGMRFEDARAKFVQFREAGLNNKMSSHLLKIRADLMALGLSAEAADHEVSRVTSVGHDPYARARAISELEHAYRGVGTGAFAAYQAIHTVDGAQAKLSNETSTVMADLWKKIGPSIGDASNRIADFAIGLVKSEEGKKAIEIAFIVLNGLFAPPFVNFDVLEEFPL